MTIFEDLKMPKVVFETTSKYNGHIQVYKIGKHYKLTSDDAEQSMTHTSAYSKRRFWGVVVDILKREEPDLRNVLILGLGGGTMQTMISKIFNNPLIVSIDIDPVMVEIARKYFNLDSIPNHRVIIEDALKVVVSPEEYDLIPCSFQALIVDLFCGEKYPELGKSGNFLAALKKMVATGGIIIFNRIYTEEHQDDVNLFIKQVENFLGDVDSQVIAGYTNSDNVIIYGRV